MSLCQQWGPPGSPTVASHFIQMATESASWHCCTLCLQVSLNLFGSWSRFFIHHSNNPLLQSFMNFSLPSTSREVSYSAMGCKLLDDVAHSGHRNINISGDGLVALRLSMLSTILFLKSSDNYLLFFLFSMLSMVHTDTQHKGWVNFSGMQVWFLYYQHLLLATGEFKDKLKEHHMLEIQLFLQFWKGANNFVQSIFGVLCGMIADLSFSFFCIFPMQINKHVNTKAFVIAAIFWEKWCTIWQKGSGANIFDHDCYVSKIPT